MSHLHHGTGEHDGLEIGGRDVSHIRHILIEAERHLGIRGHLGHYGEDTLGIGATVGLFIGYFTLGRSGSHQKGCQNKDRNNLFHFQ